jgi:hypothetical protein
MKKLKREIKLLIFYWALGVACRVLPNDAVKTWQWMANMPTDEVKHFY